MHIILTRHGHVDGIDPPRFRGRMELELSTHGLQQAQALGSAISCQFKPCKVLTSPMKRCRDTGETIARACHIPATVLAGIDDFDYGQWQGKTHSEICANFPNEFELWNRAPQWVRFPGGESTQDVALRVIDALRELWHDYRKEMIVLVAHDSINRILLLHALDLPLSAYWRIEQQPCCINEVSIGADGAVKVLRMNDTSHLLNVNKHPA